MSDNHLHADGIKEGLSTPPPVYFRILLGGLVIWATVFSAYYLLSGWSSSAEFADKMAAHQQSLSGSTGAVK